MELIFNLKCCFAWSFGGSGGLQRPFWEVLEGSGRGLGRLGQALEPLNCVLDASWERLEGFWRRLGGNLGRLGGFSQPFEGAKGRSRPRFQRVQGCFCMFFFVLFRGRKPKLKISKNVDFPQVKLICSRVWAIKSTQNRRQIENKSKSSARDAKNLTWDAKNSILEAKKAILEAKMEPRTLFWRPKWSRMIEVC